MTYWYHSSVILEHLFAVKKAIMQPGPRRCKKVQRRRPVRSTSRADKIASGGAALWPLCFSRNILKWAKLPLTRARVAERGDAVVEVSQWASLAARCMLRSGIMREIWSCSEGLGVAGSWAPIWEGRGGGFCFAAGEPEAPWLQSGPHAPAPAPRHACAPTPCRGGQIEPARKEKEAGARMIVVVTQQLEGDMATRAPAGVTSRWTPPHVTSVAALPPLSLTHTRHPASPGRTHTLPHRRDWGSVHAAGTPSSPPFSVTCLNSATWKLIVRWRGFPPTFPRE